MTTKTVSGVFNNRLEADRAVTALEAAGFSKSDISLIVSDAAHKTIFANDKDAEITENSGEKVVKGSLTGATFGGALGALLVGLTAIGGLAIPGINLLIAGPLVAAITGAGAGALTGGLTGALVGAGFDSTEAKQYESDIRAGRAVVVAHSNDEAKLAKARIALSNSGSNPTTRVA